MTGKAGLRFFNIAKDPLSGYAAIAQLVEHTTFNRGVGGSSPPGGFFFFLC